jgi:hypothetical protein
VSNDKETKIEVEDICFGNSEASGVRVGGGTCLFRVIFTGPPTQIPNRIPIEAWRSLGDIAIVWLTKLFNHIFR